MEDKNKISDKGAMPSAETVIEEKNGDILDIEGTGVDERVEKGDVVV